MSLDQRKRLSINMKNQYVDGTRDRHKITKNANKTLREKGQYTRDNSYLSNNHISKEARRRLSESRKGKGNPMWGMTGDKHPRFKNFKRNYLKRKDWQVMKKLIKIRDNFTCQACKISEREHLTKYGQVLQVHHIIPFEICQKHEKENLITVCSLCHGLCKNHDFNEKIRLTTPRRKK